MCVSVDHEFDCYLYSRGYNVLAHTDTYTHTLQSQSKLTACYRRSGWSSIDEGNGAVGSSDPSTLLCKPCSSDQCLVAADTSDDDDPCRDSEPVPLLVLNTRVRICPYYPWSSLPSLPVSLFARATGDLVCPYYPWSCLPKPPVSLFVPALPVLFICPDYGQNWSCEPTNACLEDYRSSIGLDTLLIHSCYL